MEKLSSENRRWLGAAGAMAAGLSGGQTVDAAVVAQTLDVDIPADIADYQVDLNGDAINEFDIQLFETVTKVADLAPSTALVFDPTTDNRTANLAVGTLIGPDSSFSDDGMAPSGGDPLNGTIEGAPVGNFQVSDGPGFIGVRFQITGATHYGYVGYEGTGAENDPAGHIIGIGYENAPDMPIEAGAGLSAGFAADFNGNGTVDAADYVVWRKNLGLTGTATQAQGDADADMDVDAADYNQWSATFGAGGGSGLGAVPEPASLMLLAAGAAGLTEYRRRRRE